MDMDRKVALIIISTLMLTGNAYAQSVEASPSQTPAPAQATYIANAGVMVTNGDPDAPVKIVFDPLFDRTFNTYQPLPAKTRTALLAGTAPFDNIDAVLISHYHGDHFSPADMVTFITNNRTTRLYAPAQAIAAMAKVEGGAALVDDPRITSLAIDYGAAPVRINVDGIIVEAVRIAHAGGAGRRHIENIVYRVTLGTNITVMHMGDADTDDHHFQPHDAHWQARTTDMAFVPYWFFLSEKGRTTIETRLNAAHAIGVHVPEALPDDPGKRDHEYRDLDLFTEPGQTRTIKGPVK